ncbi:MKI67 FHA domain-interacting nucleolar phosphoprotein-like isoform X2 [Melitaea cinxia]|uniref:MKI67 FHA domain-interacting nucleolar phosphoprotein-like isoform X2 n=1 Tax=Melitaea cinxia TaxID=113334 RepID=UPI001E27006D|nr:MKI67 FHA domain-interacting nucleolar phosphoprotein-like isoform X2 [Melitaea cinxia]
MEESVALDSSKQKQFVKSVRGIKKLLKKNTKKVKQNEESKPFKKSVPVKKPIPEEKKKVKEDVKKTNSNKKREIRNRGLVYLSHIPHGFYEYQMTEYFKQFGMVTNTRVIRSKHTGNSKGYAFVEFKEPAVAEIVAETMNNYLMGKRLIKAVYIPPEKQKLHARRKKWNFQNNPGSELRLKMKKALNAEKTDKEELLIAKKLLSNLSNTKEKLQKLGIDYEFFVPVDVPEVLNKFVETCKDDVKNLDTTTVVSEKKVKAEEKIKKPSIIKSESIDVKTKLLDVKNENPKNKQTKQKITKSQKEQLKENVNKNLTQGKDTKKKLHKQEKSNKEVSQKESETFIKINESESDSADFDSDAFEEIINSDDDELSSDDQSDNSDLSGDQDDDDNLLSGEESEDLNEVVQKSNNVKGKIKTNVAQEKSEVKLVKSKQDKGMTKNIPEKRKNATSEPVTPKKGKFEKQSKKTLNKVIKKRK